jgi:hypothetical protein
MNMWMRSFAVVVIGAISGLAVSQGGLTTVPFKSLDTYTPEASARTAIEARLNQLYGDTGGISYAAAKTAAGDVASGVVLVKTADSITLDTTPCIREDKRLMTFAAPYQENSITDITSGGKTHPRVQVVQKGFK